MVVRGAEPTDTNSEWPTHLNNDQTLWRCTSSPEYAVSIIRPLIENNRKSAKLYDAAMN